MKFLQLADVHFGLSPQGLLEENAATFFAMRDAAFAELPNVAKKYAVDAVLIAGDLFDSPSPPPALFTAVMQVLALCPCPVLISPGNHDYIHDASPYLTLPLPKNVHVFTTGTLSPYPINTYCSVWGAAFCGENASIILSVPPSSKDDIRIGLVHGDLFGVSANNPLTKSEIARSGLTYLAAGHNHRASGLQTAGDTHYACSGSFLTTHPMDTGEKGFYLLILRDAQAGVEFLSSQAPEYATFSIDMADIPSDIGLRQALLPHIPKAHARTIATLKLTGERVYEPNLTALHRALDQVFFQFIVQDESVLKKPLWRYLQSTDLRGNVTRNFRLKMEAAHTQEEKEQYLLALRYALAAFDHDAPPL